MKKLILLTLTLVLTLSALPATAQIATGGAYALEQSVIANGGGNSAAGGAFSLDGTVGQAVAGNAVSGPPFAVTSGFWNSTPLAPTAATVSVTGQVRTANGAGIRNAVITLTGLDGSTQIARSGSFGYYRFNEVLAGETYIVSIASKRFRFATPTIVIAVLDEVAGLDFVAVE